AGRSGRERPAGPARARLNGGAVTGAPTDFAGDPAWAYAVSAIGWGNSDGLRAVGGSQVNSQAIAAEGGGGHAGYGAGNAVGAVGVAGTHHLGGGGPANCWSVFAFGDMGALGNKNFVQPHPTDPDKVVSFICLEGNESGTYFRGTARLVAGAAVIDIPEEWQ